MSDPAYRWLKRRYVTELRELRAWRRKHPVRRPLELVWWPGWAPLWLMNLKWAFQQLWLRARS